MPKSGSSKDAEMKRGKTPPPAPIAGKPKTTPPPPSAAESTKPSPGSNAAASLIVPKMPVRMSDAEIMAQEYEKVTPMALFRTNTWINDGSKPPAGRIWWGQKKKKQKKLVMAQTILILSLVTIVILLLIVLGAVYLRRRRTPTTVQRHPKLTTMTKRCREQYGGDHYEECITEAELHGAEKCGINATLCRMKRWWFKFDKTSGVAFFKQEWPDEVDVYGLALPLEKTENAECSEDDIQEWCINGTCEGAEDEKGGFIDAKLWYPLTPNMMKTGEMVSRHLDSVFDMPCLMHHDGVEYDEAFIRFMADFVGYGKDGCKESVCPKFCNETICNAIPVKNTGVKIYPIKNGLRAELYHCDASYNHFLGTRKSICVEKLPIKVYACHKCDPHFYDQSVEILWLQSKCEDFSGSLTKEMCTYSCKGKEKGILPDGFQCRSDSVCIMGTCYKLDVKDLDR